jgi:hypothetical protein
MWRSTSKVLAGLAALAALALGGSALAGAASSSTTNTTTTTPPSSSSSQPPPFNGPAHGTAAHENAEKAVTGEAAAKAQAAAVKSVGSGTAGAVTTDFTGSGYETTVTKSDGTKVEVHLDSSFTAHDGPGGGPPPAGAGPGAMRKAAPRGGRHCAGPLGSSGSPMTESAGGPGNSGRLASLGARPVPASAELGCRPIALALAR